MPLAGFALTTSHIKCLLAVKKLSTRNQLQKKAIRNKWSIIRLQLEQRRLFGSRRPKAGRRARPLNTIAEINPRIALFALKWKGFRAEMNKLAEHKPLLLSRAFQNHLTTADKAFDTMSTIINREFDSNDAP